jgi:hypothetical protein
MINLGSSSTQENSAMAQPWTCIAAGFSIDPDSVERADVDFAVLRHRADRAGDVLAVCNVVKLHDTGSDWNSLGVIYRDQDGTGSIENLSLSLMKLATNGEQTVVASFSSSAFSGGSSVQNRSVPFEHTFDFLRFAYFIRVRLRRTVTTASENRIALYTVRLTTTA